MRRRFLTSTGAALIVTPLAVGAQAARTPKIGYLSTSDGKEPIDTRFLQTLHNLGWIEGHNIAIGHVCTVPSAPGGLNVRVGAFCHLCATLRRRLRDATHR